MSFQRKFVRRQIKEGNLTRRRGELILAKAQKKPTPWVWRTHGAELAAKKAKALHA